MQFRTLEAKAVGIIVDAFAKVMKMTPAKQAEAGYSVSPKGNRTIQQLMSPKNALNGKTGQAVSEGTVCNYWQSGTDDHDVRIYVVAPKKAKKAKVAKAIESPEATALYARFTVLEAKGDATDAKLDAVLALLSATK